MVRPRPGPLPLVLALVLAGCPKSPDAARGRNGEITLRDQPGKSNPPPPAAPSTDTLKPPPTGPTAAPAPPTASINPVRANPRAIGVAVPLTGRQKAWGEAVLQGVTLALG